MIWDLITWDHAKDLVLLGLFVWTHSSTTRRFNSQDKELKKQSQGQEWNNEVTELLAEAAKESGTIPPPKTPLPPRPKVTTLVDPLERLVEEAQRLDAKRKR